MKTPPSKLHKTQGIIWPIVILLVAITVMSIIVLIPNYKAMQRQGQTVACATALDTARRQLASNFMFNGFEDGKAEEAKEFVTFVMNGWDDLCPEGGNCYIIPNTKGEMSWDIVCGLHCADKKLCTRLNAENVREQIIKGLRDARIDGIPFPETLPFTLHHKNYTALLVDEESGLKRGTRLTMGKEKAGIVAYYGIMGHSDFGADSGAKEGSLCYFSFADEEHCANWDYREEWTGDSYRGVS